MSKIEVNTVDVKCGSTLTLGSSGKTVTIASGASTSGMGRTGTVDWQTSSIKGESFTAVNGEGYFLDTSDGSPYKNYAVTVATGTLYIVGGSGNVFNLDGSQQTAITLMKGKTYRFTQSDNTNDGHQLIISTSNSTTLGTFQAGIVSSGVTYYIDGSATQSNWINSTTFNAGTTRYIEFQPQTTGTFYFGCYNHGIGMGGIITSQLLTVTLPSSPSAGNIIAIKDYSLNFDTNGIEINRNGSPFNGTSGTVFPSITTEGASVVLVYVDSTKGWVPTQDDASSLVSSSPTYVAATGGTVSTVCTDYKVHVFTSPGTFCVSSAGNSAGSNTVDYLVIAGGGSSSQGYNSYNGAGGGAGGYRFSNGTASGSFCAGPSPLGATALPVTATGFPITVGAGGARVPGDGEQPGLIGADSVFSTITSAGGGAGRNHYPSIPSDPTSANGGSGGGGSAPWQGSPTSVPGGAGNTPPVSPPQGNNGGATPTNNNAGGGGGGAGAVGGDAPGNNNGGAGGAGLASTITGSAVTRGGGGGGAGSSSGGAGGSGGGGQGGIIPSTSGVAGTANTGGGAGGGAGKSPPGSITSYNAAGGSGVVIIRYKFQ